MRDQLSGPSNRRAEEELKLSFFSTWVSRLKLLTSDPSLGFNDKGESIPFQGGTNEQVVDRLYKKLTAEKKEQYLKVYW
jgi:hypothetical protein